MVGVRTTLTIDDDVLEAARVLAEQQNRSIGNVVSTLVRQALSRPGATGSRNGLPLLPVSSPDAHVTLEIVNALRDEAP